MATIRAYSEAYPRLATFVETGLWNGTGSWEGLKAWRSTIRVLVVDMDPANVSAAVRKGAHGFLGDSGELLQSAVLPFVDEPALFWLDAHYLAEYDGEDSSPLAGELAAIVDWEHAGQSVVLVDDFRLLGRPGYPTDSQLWDLTMTGRGLWEWKEQDDILRLTPK